MSIRSVLLVALVAATGCLSSSEDPDLVFCIGDSSTYKPGCTAESRGPTSVAVRPFALGDQTQTAWIAEDGSASIWIDADRLHEAVVDSNNESLAFESATGTWKLSDTSVGDALEITGTNSTTGADFSTTLALQVATVETVDIGYANGLAVIELRSADGDRLVDTTLRLAASNDGVSQRAWDQIALPAPGRYVVTVTASSFGQRTFDIEI